MPMTHAQQAALYFARRQRQALARAQVVAFVPAEIAANAANGAAAGSLSVRNGVGTYTFTLTDDAGGLFAIDGDLVEKADTLVAGEKYTIVVEADNGVDDPLSMSFQVQPT
jgi:hypothetical protein